VRSALAYFGFKQKQMATSVADLSGGEKTRLLLAVIAAKSPDLIIMDEPTNHLDFETRETLIEAINEYNGAVVLISHDWDLLAKTMKNYWLVDNGKVVDYKKGLDAYRIACTTPPQAQAKSAKAASSVAQSPMTLMSDKQKGGKSKGSAAVPATAPAKGKKDDADASKRQGSSGKKK
jgi:ATPase subunit of ABC transporter with duplicated ATPase domains